VRLDNFAASWGSNPGRDAKRGPAVLLLFVALAPAMAVAQPLPVFTELFAYDPSAPSQLLGKWLISSQLDTKSQPLRVGVVEDPIGKMVGRITVEEGDGLAGANEAMLQARDYICNSEGSRAAAVEAEPGGVVPSEREISGRDIASGENLTFGTLCQGPFCSWLAEMLARKPKMLVTVALANKMARIIWPCWSKGGTYRTPAAAA
jgi:hypothetical protein